MTLPYNRALHTDDYDHAALRPFALALEDFEHILSRRSIPYRKDHQHRGWEYANVLRQLDELGVRPPASLLDTGSGGSYIAPYLARLGYQVTVEDSMAYGDITSFLIAQCQGMSEAGEGIQLPILKDPVEAMISVPDETFDATLCVSVIEHVDAAQYQQALAELARVTKIDGFVFMTSDFFRDDAQADASPFRQIQHTRYTPALAAQVGVIEPRLEFVGPDDFSYRGDFVHNYSFVNFCLRRVR